MPKRKQEIFDIHLDNDFLDITPKAQTIKDKIEKWDHIKLKSLCHSKGNNQQSEKVGAAWEKIFSYHVSNTGLVFKYIRN